MNLNQKLKEAKEKRKEIIEQVNELADQVSNLQEQRQTLLQEALRFDGECRILEALVKEEKKE